MAKTATEETTARERHWLNDKFIKQVTTALAADGASVTDVAAELGVSKGQVALAKLRGQIPVKDREDFSEADDAKLSKRVQALRDGENLSWGVISARLGVPESKVRTAYDPDNHGRGLRLEGRGGRSPGETNGSAPSKAKAAKPKVGAGKSEADVNPSKKNLQDMDVAELRTRLTGQTMSIGRSAKSEKVQVKKVVKLAKGEVHVIAADGKNRVFKVSDIVRVTK